MSRVHIDVAERVKRMSIYDQFARDKEEISPNRWILIAELKQSSSTEPGLGRMVIALDNKATVCDIMREFTKHTSHQVVGIYFSGRRLPTAYIPIQGLVSGDTGDYFDTEIEQVYTIIFQ